MVAGCAPGVRTIASSVLFHSITGFTACENSELSVSPPNATPGIPAVCAQSVVITSATILKQFRIEVLLSLLLSRKHQVTPAAQCIPTPADRLIPPAKYSRG